MNDLQDEAVVARILCLLGVVRDERTKRKVQAVVREAVNTAVAAERQACWEAINAQIRSGISADMVGIRPLSGTG